MHGRIESSKPPRPTVARRAPRAPTAEELRGAADPLAWSACMHEVSWADAGHRAAACAYFAALAATPDLLASAPPLVIRGGAASWRAAREWTVDELVRRGGGLRGVTRIAPTPQFPFVMPAHVRALAAATGADSLLPSTTREVRPSCIA
jgi:hypothetical protein